MKRLPSTNPRRRVGTAVDDAGALGKSVARDARHAARGASFLAVHLVVVAFFSVTIYATHGLFKSIGDPLIFDRFPVRYIFEAGELGVVMVFIFGGVRDALGAFRH